MNKNMYEKNMYDLCIVGAGMVGSSAARHASNIPQTKVCLIGPKEPQDCRTTTIFGAYFDEGRITRKTDKDPFWGLLARRSLANYAEVEHRTGITFYSENGCLTVGSKERIDRSVKDVEDQDIDVRVMNSEEGRAAFPLVHFKEDHYATFEPCQAGYINPRKLVQAQQTAAHLQGCDIIENVVRAVREEKRLDGNIVMCVECESGEVIHSKKVLLATGAFTSFRHLLPDGMVPDVNLVTQTVVLAEVPPEQLAVMQKMPSVLYGAVGTDVYDSYSLPPIIYPDGKYYLKLGHGTRFENNLSTEVEVAEWYRNQPPQEYKDGLLQIVNKVYPKLKPASVRYDTCVTTTTHNKRPYIDVVKPSLGVALAGNGYAAKSCDEFGRLAVQLIMFNKWDIPFPREEFKLRVKLAKSKI